MIIANAQVHLHAQQESLSVRQETLDVQFWRDRPAAENNQDRLDISLQGQLASESVNTQQMESLRKNIELEVSLLKQLVERLSGRKIEFIVFDPGAEAVEATAPDLANVADQGGNWGLAIDRTLRTEETERLSFGAAATVNTTDGQSIAISLSLNYARSSVHEETFSLRAGQALKDPLILNFSGSALELSSKRFEFDLDVDGQMDQVPTLKSDAAYLALDRNLDGVINNGSELFGALSGNGFLDLTEFDSDSNQWIDSNDAVFSQLRLYQPGSDGTGQLITLSEKGVGALYLGQVSTPFRLTDASDQLAGEIRSSGLYLMESGKAGVIHQVDLVV